MNKRNKKKGFTLIEMIVVIGIIAILVGIAVPQVTKYTNNSKKQSDIANAKTIATAIQQGLAEGNELDTTVTTASGSSSTQTITIYKLVNDTNIEWIKKYLPDIPKVKFNSKWQYVYSYDGEVLKIGIFKSDESTVVNSQVEVVYPSLNSSNEIYK